MRFTLRYQLRPVDQSVRRRKRKKVSVTLCLKNQFPFSPIPFKEYQDNPGLALIDIQSFSALIQRFLRFQRCSELNQTTLILTSLVITDSVMNISEHLWFSVEHYRQAANRQRPWKKPEQVFFFNIDAEETRNRKFQNNFKWVILKNSKNVIFPKSVFSFDYMSENFLLEQKKWKIPKYLLQLGKKRNRS